MGYGTHTSIGVGICIGMVLCLVSVLVSYQHKYRYRYGCLSSIGIGVGMNHQPGAGRRSFCLISLAINIIEGWDIINLKCGIHSSVWSTKTFLYNIREPRYKQIKIMNNLIYLNLIPPRFMHTFSSYEHFRRLGHVPF